MGMKKHLLSFTLLLSVAAVSTGSVLALTQQQSGSTGLEGTVLGSAPTQAATITVPKNGQSFSSVPVNVAGLCPQGLLVEIFKNNVFAGSVQCSNGSYSIQIDLFSGKNDLVARVYDSLNQAGPDSNTVSVTFNDSVAISGPRISLITAYAKRGANPKETLTWPLTISGGTPPYAISADWGDKSRIQLTSLQTPGDFEQQHIYNTSGSYNIIFQATDANGQSAYLQVVGISNGPIQQTTGANQAGGTTTIIKRVILWWPIIVLFILTVIAFWLGKRHETETIKKRLHSGKNPF
jgi:hypothetical protein